MLTISSLAGGGAQRVISLLVNNLDRRRFAPFLVLFDDVNDYGADFLREVDITCLRVRNSWAQLPKIISALASVMRRERPSISLSFLNDANYFTIMASYFAPRPPRILVSVHNNTSRRLAENAHHRLHALAVRHLYPRAAAVICVSGGVRQDLVHNFGLPPAKCRVRYNPCDISFVQKQARAEVAHPWFHQDVPLLLACGSFKPQKNYPLLLKATALACQRTNLRLAILGKGPEMGAIQSYAQSLGLASQVAFLGFDQNPYKYMSRATGLVLSSSYEGFGMVLVEAMACGTPVIATRCPYGPEEIVTPGVNGLLVPVNDASTLAAAMVELVSDPGLCGRLVSGGRARAEDFQAGKVAREYEALFEEVLAH